MSVAYCWLKQRIQSRYRSLDSKQVSIIGQQAGGRVLLFMHVSNLQLEVQRLIGRGIRMEGPVRIEDFGKVCVAADCYGNRWDLIERNTDVDAD